MSVEKLKRLAGFTCLQNLIAECYQRIPGEAPDSVIVLDDKHRPRTDRQRRGLLLVQADGFGRAVGMVPRQIEFDRRALAELAVEFDVTPGLLQKSVYLAEPEAGPLSG